MKKPRSSNLRQKGFLSKFIWAGLFLIIFGLGALGYLQPVEAFLSQESLSFSVGTLRISAYLFLKGLFAIAVLVWTSGMITDFGAAKIKKLKKISASNRALINKAWQIAVYFVAFLIALDVLGIDLTALTVFGGAIGIGLGFGLQKITANFISGIILLFEKSIVEGDLVELMEGTTGFVKRTDARYTLIETFEGREVMVPNEEFITTKVTNWTFSHSSGRMEINIGVSYDTDLDLAYSLILQAANEHPYSLKKPKPECYLIDFADSAVVFQLNFWVGNIIENRKRPRSDVLFSIWRKFNENGIVIPFPQRDVHIKNAG